MTQRSYPVQAVKVQVCFGTPSADSSWTDATWLRLEEAGEGCGQVYGSAVLTQRFGIVGLEGLPGLRSVGQFPDLTRSAVATSIRGKLIRLMVQTTAGDPSSGFTQFWAGVAVSDSLSPDGRTSDAGGTVVWQCEGLGSILAQHQMVNSRIKNSNATGGYQNPGHVPVFNDGRGNRSASKIAGAYAFDFDAAADDFWTAYDILEHVFSVVNEYSTSGLTWVLSDSENCLGYYPDRVNFDGASAADILNDLAGFNRGISWRATLSGGTVTVAIDSTARSAIVGSSSYTLPACSTQGYVDVRNNQWYRDLQFTLDEGSTYDKIVVTGRKPWYGLTVKLTATEKDWEASNETAWAADPTSAMYAEVFRRFKLLSTWDQQQVDTAADGVREYTDADGTRAWSSSASIRFPTSALALERLLPASITWTNIARGSRQSPIIIAHDASTNIDYSTKWNVMLDPTDNTITLDDGQNGALIKAWLAESGGAIYVSLGIRAATPMQVWWERTQSEWPRQTPRVKYIAHPDAEQHITLEGTYQGVDISDGSIQKTGADITSREDTDDLKDWLALARAHYETPAASISWTHNGGIYYDTSGNPGVLWQYLTTADGNHTLDAVVTARRWRRTMDDGVPHWQTTYEARRILPDIGGLR